MAGREPAGFAVNLVLSEDNTSEQRLTAWEQSLVLHAAAAA